MNWSGERAEPSSAAGSRVGQWRTRESAYATGVATTNAITTTTATHRHQTGRRRGSSSPSSNQSNSSSGGPEPGSGWRSTHGTIPAPAP
jgi:hypothetical protein